MAQLKSPVFDYEKGDFETKYEGAAFDSEFNLIATQRVVTVEDAAAAEQRIIKALATPRGQYLIYANPADPDLDHKYGSDISEILRSTNLDEEARLSELKRAIYDALIYEDIVEDVYDITVAKTGADVVTASFSVKTVFDTTITVQGVEING